MRFHYSAVNFLVPNIQFQTVQFRIVCKKFWHKLPHYTRIPCNWFAIHIIYLNLLPEGSSLPLWYQVIFNLGSCFGSTRQLKWTGSPSPTALDWIWVTNLGAVMGASSSIPRSSALPFSRSFNLSKLMPWGSWESKLMSFLLEQTKLAVVSAVP